MLKENAAHQEAMFERNLAALTSEHNDRLQAMIQRAEETERTFLVFLTYPSIHLVQCLSNYIAEIGTPKASFRWELRAISTSDWKQSLGSKVKVSRTGWRTKGRRSDCSFLFTILITEYLFLSPFLCWMMNMFQTLKVEELQTMVDSLNGKIRNLEAEKLTLLEKLKVFFC